MKKRISKIGCYIQNIKSRDSMSHTRKTSANSNLASVKWRRGVAKPKNVALVPFGYPYWYKTRKNNTMEVVGYRRKK